MEPYFGDNVNLLPLPVLQIRHPVLHPDVHGAHRGHGRLLRPHRPRPLGQEQHHRRRRSLLRGPRAQARVQAEGRKEADKYRVVHLLENNLLLTLI